MWSHSDYNHPVAARMTHFCERACKVTEKDFCQTTTFFFFTLLERFNLLKSSDIFTRKLGDILISALSILLNFVDDGSLMVSDRFNWLSPFQRGGGSSPRKREGRGLAFCFHFHVFGTTAACLDHRCSLRQTVSFLIFPKRIISSFSKLVSCGLQRFTFMCQLKKNNYKPLSLLWLPYWTLKSNPEKEKEKEKGASGNR